MSTFAEDMLRLGESIVRSRAERRATIEEIRGATQRHLAASRESIDRAASASLEQRRSNLPALRAEAAERAQEVRAMLDSFLATRTAAAADEAIERRRQVADIAHGVRSDLARYRRELEQQAQRSSEDRRRALEELGSLRPRLQQEVRELLQSAREQQRQATADLHTDLDAFVLDIRERVARLLHEHRQELQGFAAEFHEGARALRRALGAAAFLDVFDETPRQPAPASSATPAASAASAEQDDLATLETPSRRQASALSRRVPSRAPVSGLALSTRVVAALAQAGIVYLDQLHANTPEMLLAIPGIGPASVREIQQAIADTQPWGGQDDE